MLAKGAATWLGDLVLLREDLLRFFLNPVHVESDDRLQGLGGVTSPCPFSLADLFTNR